MGRFGKDRPTAYAWAPGHCRVATQRICVAPVVYFTFLMRNLVPMSVGRLGFASAPNESPPPPALSSGLRASSLIWTCGHKGVGQSRRGPTCPHPDPNSPPSRFEPLAITWVLTIIYQSLGAKGLGKIVL